MFTVIFLLQHKHKHIVCLLAWLWHQPNEYANRNGLKCSERLYLMCVCDRFAEFHDAKPLISNGFHANQHDRTISHFMSSSKPKKQDRVKNYSRRLVKEKQTIWTRFLLYLLSLSLRIHTIYSILINIRRIWRSSNGGRRFGLKQDNLLDLCTFFALKIDAAALLR